MADGVKIRIVGDDSDFIATLENLEKRVRRTFTGGSLFSQVSAGISQALQALGDLTVGVGVNGDLASGIAGQQNEAETAAGQVAAGVQTVLQNRMGAYRAGVQMATRYRAGMLSQRAAIVHAAQSLASAAAAPRSVPWHCRHRFRH